MRSAPMFTAKPRAAIFFFSSARYSGVASDPMKGSLAVRVSIPVSL